MRNFGKYISRKMAAEVEGGEGIVRRNRPGLKNSELYGWPEQDYTEMDSILDVQQHIQQMVRQDPADVEAILEPPPTQNNEACWKYEHLRQFCNQLNGIAIRLQVECDPKQCIQMTATEQWIFLCAAHKEPKECSALDYTLHTLHGAASLLNSSKHFPSRFDIKETSIQRLGSVARRVYRIFAHTYFHHRSLFDEFEAETHLCRRFTRFVTKYELMSPENLMVPIDIDPTESSA